MLIPKVLFKRLIFTLAFECICNLSFTLFELLMSEGKMTLKRKMGHDSDEKIGFLSFFPSLFIGLWITWIGKKLSISNQKQLPRMSQDPKRFWLKVPNDNLSFLKDLELSGPTDIFTQLIISEVSFSQERRNNSTIKANFVCPCLVWTGHYWVGLHIYVGE